MTFDLLYSCMMVIFYCHKTCVLDGALLPPFHDKLKPNIAHHPSDLAPPRFLPLSRRHCTPFSIIPPPPPLSNYNHTPKTSLSIRPSTVTFPALSLTSLSVTVDSRPGCQGSAGEPGCQGSAGLSRIHLPVGLFFFLSTSLTINLCTCPNLLECQRLLDRD